MSDPVFLPPAAPLTLADVAALTGSLLVGPVEPTGTVPTGTVPTGTVPTRIVHGVAAILAAGPGEVTCLDEEFSDASMTRAGACFVTPAHRDRLPPSTPALITDDPAAAFAALVETFYPRSALPTSVFATRGVSPAAFIHSEARIEEAVTIDPGVVVGPGAEIGTGSVIGANSVIGPQVRIGRHCAIGAQVTLTHALLGNAVTIHPGARIGHDRPQRGAAGLGRVVIQDGVEIGANATIDRGGLADTVLGESCRIGNLTHIARDRVVERHALVGIDDEAVTLPARRRE